MVISRYIKADLDYIDDFSLNQDTKRGCGGFGSTGEFDSTKDNNKE
jgi:dUTPase